MNKIATRESYGNALAKLGRINKDIVVLDADLSKSTKTANFAKLYPERFFDVGIAEQNLMGAAAGFASCGKIPFASSFAVFASGRAFEQIRNSIAYPKLNVKIAATHAGITVGEDGATHESVEDISIMRAIPNMTVVNPADDVETKAAIKAAVEYKGPMYIRLGRLSVPVIYDEDTYAFELGKGVVLREGDDAVIFATGIMVSTALEAYEALKTKEINVSVIDIHTIKPIDERLIVRYAFRTGAVVTAEENNIMGGFGSAVSEVISQRCPVPIKFVGIKDEFGQSGKPEELLTAYHLTKDDIVKAVTEAIGMKKQI